jgi:hypothetical protein
MFNRKLNISTYYYVDDLYGIIKEPKERGHAR